MKYCPYCGAEVNDGAVSFCSECGKPFQGQEEATTKTHEKKGASGKSTKKKARKEKPAKQMKVKKEKPKKKSKDIPEIIGEPVDDGYDGYYNDVLPPDTDRVKDGMDKELVKKIVALCIGVSVIILMCVALLYVL